jgi:catechol 2,3-dioxygenase-like lactoylglutathione lyase family enzyme
LILWSTGIAVEMWLELVVLPVSDVDRAKAFYRSAGFREDLDYAAGAEFRVVRFTPPGSAGSIVFGTGITGAPPGTAAGLHLLVPDLELAIGRLRDAGVEVTDAFHDIGGVFYRHSPEYEVPGRDPARRDGASFARFSDPDGNSWVLEERTTRAPGADG